jgi:hypothetical protein
VRGGSASTCVRRTTWLLAGYLAPIAEVEDDEAGERLESQKGTIKSGIIN